MKPSPRWLARARRATRAAWFALAALALLVRPASGANERDLWSVWKLHRAQPADHAAVLAACTAFEKSNPDDPLQAVTRGLAGWHLLKLDRHDEARARWESLLAGAEGAPLEQAAATMARAWLTRLDAIAVHSALQTYYRRHVEYPASLDALAALTGSPATPLTDRWNRPWDYEALALRRLGSLPKQRYTLACRSLQTPLALDAALDLPYAGAITLEPAALSLAGATPVVRFEPRGGGETARPGPVVLTPGGRYERILFAWIGERLIVLADPEHWKVLPTPPS